MSASPLLQEIKLGHFAALAKAITLVENELPGSVELLQQLEPNSLTQLIGITGPPGAGKSSLVNALLHQLAATHRIAVLSVDPSSPFNLGALLGDRIRMNEFYLNPNVFIRSMASRGSLGGLCPAIIEITEVLRSSNFDYVFIETVGVGQSEIEISGLADTTLVVMVPEAGDEIQTMKAGVMEIADIFIVNKSDRSQADEFIRNLKILVHDNMQAWQIPVIKSIATDLTGIDEIIASIQQHKAYIGKHIDKRMLLLSEKAYQIIQKRRMADVSKRELQEQLKQAIISSSFNLFRFAAQY